MVAFYKALSLRIRWPATCESAFTCKSVLNNLIAVWSCAEELIFSRCIDGLYMTSSQKHEYVNVYQFALNSGMACKTIQPVFCTKFEVIWIIENRFMGQRSWRVFCYVVWENGLVGILLSTNMAAAIQIFVWRFSEL